MSLLAEIHAHATERPDAIAIAERGRPALSYRALVEAAAALAARLRAEGVGPEQVVALAMEKSTEWVIGALAAWWCGAAWMPLDPGLPAVRRRRLLRVADAKLALVSPRTGHAEALPRAIPVTLERGEGAAPFARVPADTLAYVIFSSGSTGAPKGIAVTWAGLPSMLAAQREAFSLGAGDRCLWVLSTSFDASISDVFTALGAGASLHIEPPARTPTALVEQLARCAITHVDLPPAMLAKMSPDDAPQTLRTVIIGGEVCPAEAVRRWAARVRLVNVYGPTEATVCTSLARCDPNAEHGARIGRPLPGVIYRLVEGELWIGGAQVARGYLGEGPADRFVEREGERYFRTGDRVSRLAEGEYTWRGRVDRQIKLRGVLVAPEEVEACLRAHTGVERVAVVCRALGARDALVAFYEGSAPTDALLAHAAAQLPRSLVPAQVVHVDALPLGPTGKVDLASLRSRPLGHRAPRGGAPRTSTERAVAALYAEVLGLEEIGREDELDALGGDSFALVELVARAAARGLSLGPELVADHGSVAALAAALDRGASGVMRMDALRDAAVPSAALARAIASRRAPAGHPSRPASRAPRRVLLTGATGFLGRRLRRALEARTDRVICLVRDPARGEGRGELVGDVSRPSLGLRESRWRALVDEVDAVVHCAATVSLARSFEALRATNVSGTAEALRLACEAGASFHCCSTLSVFVSTDRAERVAREDDDLRDVRRVYGGYAQSKVAAELVVRYAEGAIPITQYRLGLLTGARDDAAAPPHDWLGMLVRGLARVAAWPDDADPELAFDVTPVDHAADAMARLVTRADQGLALETFHIAAARATRLTALIEAMRAEGVSLEPVPSARFARRLGDDDLIDAATRLALSRALGSSDERRALELFQATRARFDLSRASAAGVVAPEPDPRLLRRYVRRMLESS
ncbi:MAG: hypothetical protein SangKO_028080 [Sandaracinaceae bacterium]